MHPYDQSGRDRPLRAHPRGRPGRGTFLTRECFAAVMEGRRNSQYRNCEGLPGEEVDMTEDLKPNEATQETAISRREFSAVSLAAGLAAMAGTPAVEAAERPLTETEVMVKTPDGN